MARDEDDDDGLPPIGEGTEGHLEDAKKGKSRCFLLICKGTKVKYLKVKKKAIKKSEIAEAKKQGYKGDPYIGVLTGKGMELVFNLAIADGYDSEPVKDKALKDFLEEKAGFKCKPTFAILAKLPELPFDEEDLSHPLVARFIALSEQASLVLDKYPDAETELANTTAEIRGQLQDGEFDIAEPRVNALEARLKEFLSGVAASATPATGSSTVSQSPVPQTTAPNENDALRAKLQDALNKLVPQLKQAIEKFPDRKVELLGPVAQIKKQLEDGDLVNARAGLLSVGQMLKSLAPGGGGVSIMKLGKARVEWLTTRDQAVSDLSRLKTIIANEFADDAEQAGALSSALQILDELIATVENDLHEQLDAILNSPSNDRSPLVIIAKSTIAALVDTLDNNEVMQEIDGNEFDPAMKVVGPLKAKLQEVSAALG